MSQKKPVSSDIITRLEISAQDENNVIALPEVYTQESMPVAFSPMMISLDFLTLGRTFLQSKPICNVSKALEPWELVNSQGDGSYAVKPKLGWVVNGPLNGCSMDSCPRVTANIISIANLEELLLQQYDHDFSESSEDKIEMSFEDNGFMNRAENPERWCHSKI